VNDVLSIPYRFYEKEEVLLNFLALVVVVEVGDKSWLRGMIEGEEWIEEDERGDRWL